MFVSAPEDTILKKLAWAKDFGGSERQVRDGIKVYELQHASLDRSYLERWVGELQVETLWERVLAEAKPWE